MQKPSTCRARLFRWIRCKFWVEVSRFSLCVINLSIVQQIFLLRVKESCEKQSAGLLWATNFGFVARFSLSPLITLNLSWIHTKQINQSKRFISSTRHNRFCCALVLWRRMAVVFEFTSCKQLRNVYILWCLTWSNTKNINKLERVRNTDGKSILSFKGSCKCVWERPERSDKASAHYKYHRVW